MKYLLPALAIALLLSACGHNAGLKKAEDPEDAAREFVTATLNGDYNKAYFYLYKDSMKANQMILDSWKASYDHLPEADKVNYKQASIIVKSLDRLSDSTSLFNYSNSYKNKQQTIKVVRIGGEWLVDLKDPFTGNK